MTVLAEQIDTHLANFKKFDPHASGLPFLKQLRQSAMARFRETGFPSMEEEEWRFTNLAPVINTPFKLPGPDATRLGADIASHLAFGNQAACEMVFVNGRFAPALSHMGSLPRGVRVWNLAQTTAGQGELLETHLARYAPVDGNPFIALNTAFLGDAAVIHLARGAAITGCIHVIFVSTDGAEPTITHPRILLVAEENSEAALVESYIGGGNTYCTNAVTEIVLGPSARLDHCKLQEEGPEGLHIANMHVQVGRSANFISHSASTGSKLTRNGLNVVLAGEYADATLNGLVIANGDQRIDNHTLLDHAQPNCPSHELYKHVLDGKSSCVFKGKILVRPGAQKTDSKQTNKSLLLSDDASMNSQPALEIYADDVKCTHGSTSGPVDEEMVFYLRSRGVGLEAARHLLTYAFAADITRRIKVVPVRERLEDFMASQHGLPRDLRITDLGSHDEAVVA